jgi:hypothetical protein
MMLAGRLSGLIPLTVAEVRRLPAHLTSIIPTNDRINRWSRWGFVHQHTIKHAITSEDSALANCNWSTKTRARGLSALPNT